MSENLIRIPITGCGYTVGGISVVDAMCNVAEHFGLCRDENWSVWDGTTLVAHTYDQAAAAMDSLGWFGTHDGRPTRIFWDLIEDKAAMVAAVQSVPVTYAA